MSVRALRLSTPAGKNTFSDFARDNNEYS